MLYTKSDISIVKKRKEYIYISKNSQVKITPYFVVQILQGQHNTIRLGFTVTKKNGGAVIRNRIKRRMRSLTKIIMPNYGKLGYTYIFIARKPAIVAKFHDLKKCLIEILK